MPLVSVSLVVGELYKRYRSGDISMEQFKSMSASATGIKFAKFTALLVGLSIPGVNVVVGAGMVARWSTRYPSIWRDAGDPWKDQLSESNIRLSMLISAGYCERTAIRRPVRR